MQHPEVESYLLKINLRVILNLFNICCRVYLRLLMQNRPIIKENTASVLAAHQNNVLLRLRAILNHTP